MRAHAEMVPDATPAGQGNEQRLQACLQTAALMSQGRGLADRLLDRRIERDGAPDQRATRRCELERFLAGAQRRAQALGNTFADPHQRPAETVPPIAEIAQREHKSSGHNADADLRHAPHCHQEDVLRIVNDPGEDDRPRVPCERSRVTGEVGQNRRQIAKDP